MSNVVKIENTTVSAMTEAEMLNVLKNSLYPGAKDESIKLVLGYCKAAGLDPMQKPVHIVPISVKKSDGNYVMVDTVMPGIGLYRTQASRTGNYAGISEPEFGPTKILKVGDFSLEYPEWCRVSVKRVVGGHIVEFTANERWLENYATAKRDTAMPNAMWKRRPFAQLAKCAEAQALRKAFPELGAQPTADETIIDNDDGAVVIDHSTQRPAIEQPRARSEKPKGEEVLSESEPAAASHSPTSPQGGGGGASDQPFKPMLDGQKKIIRAKLKNADRTEVDLQGKFGKSLEAADEKGFSFADFNEIQKWLAEVAG